MSITNAKTLPKRYYGLHMVEGVAEYVDPKVNNGLPYRIFIGEKAIKNMDASFEGRPVYVRHVEEVDLKNLQAEADGYVVKSFFNKSDGKHWVEFMVVSDKGHESIRSGWKLSNAYQPKDMSGGGLWHGVEYAKEVMTGEYEHLAIVPNPRYEESIILTPEQFKAYNSEKELELNKVANSKGDKPMLNFFKRAKVENSTDFEGMSVILPKSKIEKTLSELVAEMDAIHNMQGYANGDHMVKVGEEEMSVNDLSAKYAEMKNAEKEAAEAEEKKKNEEKDGDVENKKKKNESDEAATKNAADAAAAKKLEDEKKNKAFEALKNAHVNHANGPSVVDLASDKVARGKDRYGR